MVAMAGITSESMSETLAAVDVGTNSLHLVVARTTSGARFEVLTREKEMVRLGSGGSDMDQLTDDAMDRAVAALNRFRRIADAHGAPLRAVATSAVREADNQDVFLDRARDEAGVEVEVVSGAEEARLIHLGVLQALEVFDRRMMLFDIGGGSTELLIAEGRDVLVSASLKLGAVRLTNRFFPGPTLHPSAVDSCRRHIQDRLVSFERAAEQHGFETVVACSGTAEQVVRIARAMDGQDPVRTLNGASVTRDGVQRVVDAAIAARLQGTTAGLPDLDAKRADILLAGALVLEGVVQRFGIEEITFSDYALREGVFLDTIARRSGGALPHLRDVALRSVDDLLEAFDNDPDHARHVTYLALQLFDALAGDHGEGARARNLLEAAGLLANVGLAVSHSQHHKHSYYVIRNSDRLVGFTDPEIELIALIARYHRKSVPKAKHPEWAALDAPDQRLVTVAAAVLRVAIGLDRSHSQLVDEVSARRESDRIVIDAVPVRAGMDLELEQYSATERAGLLETVLDLPVSIEVAVAAPPT